MGNKAEKIKIIKLEILRLIKISVKEETKLFSIKEPLERMDIEVRLTCLNARIEGYQDWTMQLENNQINKKALQK